MDSRSVKNRDNELSQLLEKKDAQRKQELLKAVENSPRSFDEIMAFLKAGLVMPYNILIGGGMKRMIKNSYMAAKKERPYTPVALRMWIA